MHLLLSHKSYLKHTLYFIFRLIYNQLSLTYRCEDETHSPLRISFFFAVVKDPCRDCEGQRTAGLCCLQTHVLETCSGIPRGNLFLKNIQMCKGTLHCGFIPGISKTLESQELFYYIWLSLYFFLWVCVLPSQLLTQWQ